MKSGEERVDAGRRWRIIAAVAAVILAALSGVAHAAASSGVELAAVSGTARGGEWSIDSSELSPVLPESPIASADAACGPDQLAIAGSDHQDFNLGNDVIQRASLEQPHVESITTPTGIALVDHTGLHASAPEDTSALVLLAQPVAVGLAGIALVALLRRRMA